MDKKLDLRVMKTHKALLKALYYLLCEKSFDAITVTEICENAEIRKATFYKHFADKSELLTYMIKDLQRESKEENMIAYDPEMPQSYYIGVFHFFISFLEANEHFIQQVLSSRACSTVIDILSEQIEFDLSNHFKEDRKRGKTLRADSSFLASLYTGAIVYCGRWWISQKNRLSKEIMIAQFSELTMQV